MEGTAWSLPGVYIGYPDATDERRVQPGHFQQHVLLKDAIKCKLIFFLFHILNETSIRGPLDLLTTQG